MNDFIMSMGKPPLFKVQLVGLTKEVKLNEGCFSVHPELLIKDVAKTDLIIIPAFHGDMQKSLDINKGFAPWII